MENVMVFFYIKCNWISLKKNLNFLKLSNWNAVVIEITMTDTALKHV